MWTKIKRGLFSNWGMKILAFIAAVVLWVIVVNVDDPTKTASFTATVTVINDDVLTSQGKYYTIPENNATVTFRVTAKRSIIDRLNNSDFSAVADMTYLQEDNRIPIEITANAYASAITISAQTHYLQIEVGNEMQNRYVVSGEAKGKPADGCTVRSVTVMPNIISVEGPDTVVSKIDRIVAWIDVEGMSSDISETVVPMYLDADGNTIDTTELTVSSETVEIAVDMANFKTVPIVVETSGELSEDYELDSITTDPEEIAIMGEATAINDITEITIPPTVIDLSQTTADVTTTVDISAYLPYGVSLYDSSQTQVTIHVKLAEEMSRNFTVPMANLSVDNLAAGLRAVFDAEDVTVAVTGDRNTVRELSAESITGSVDASELRAGSHTLEITFELPQGLTADHATVRLTITEEDADGGEDGPAGSEGQSGSSTAE